MAKALIYGSGTWDNQNICCDASLTDYTMTAFVEFCPKSIFETNLEISATGVDNQNNSRDFFYVNLKN